ncbi:MAG TPA: phosphate/phosphite/phosphonate ABC transporter substrate-binding protein [Polyangiaceae bacterium]|nr:MAG: Phosphate-import protein PhnD precursor [Deltaproteobacteria bacterium ADurb.Bin207]HNS96045.1 phosphate/phosphite/phosphonate ABC transporter substrate-binding protein [Polyangiaceae bacterium]HNZ22364.1 phosphate/phosphite/phosphonate ABC transporter substrate-binding protein [Polyangiaceae bacterium]HOD20898.1 phosphate/phosphite/phosphonate ABC transporter substrate-binding protein [Polyangiaceae bacterium]HOE49064.1 phosphate/phosphite/phosphonate ABC transporter substrate-binding 
MRFPILRFGVVPAVDDPTFRANLKDMVKALGYHLGTTVECRVTPTYSALVALMTQGQLDAAWVPPVLAMDFDAQRIAHPRIAMIRQNETVYHSVLYALRDAQIRSVSDLQGAKAAWVSPDSASGYLVPLASMRARGLSLTKAFSDQVFLGTHEAVARAVAHGQAHVGASFAHFEPSDFGTPVWASWIEFGLEVNFRVLLVAGPIPTDVISMHRSLDDQHQQAIIHAFSLLTSDKQTSEAARAIFRCEGFAGCTEEHLRGLRTLLRLLDRRRG